MSKFVYSFSEGSKAMSELLGNKGANLADMTKLGLPVPFGFTIAADACKEYIREKKIKEGLLDELSEKMVELEEVTSKKLGDEKNPLLVSAAISPIVYVPGIMDEIVGIGLNDKSVIGLANITENERFAYDTYSTFIREFAEKIIGISKHKFNTIIVEYTGKAREKGEKITTEQIKNIIIEYKKLIKEETGDDFPQEIGKQLIMSVEAIYNSWMGEIASSYRERNKIKDSTGIAINIQSMVFGNTGEGSCTGAAFTRNPIRGDRSIYGEFKVNAEEGHMTYEEIPSQPLTLMKENLTKEYASLIKIADILEKHFKETQEMLFTVERHKLYMLQTKKAKTTTDAAIKIAVDMVSEGLINREEAIMRLKPVQIEQLMSQYIDQGKLASGKLQVKREIINAELERNPDEEQFDFADYFKTLMRWCDDIKKLEVRSTTDNQLQALQSLALGAEGIGLCKTETIGDEEEHASKMEALLSQHTEEQLAKTLEMIYPKQKTDIKRIYETMGERRVAIRILDLPSQETNTPFNRRGCRLAISYPEIVRMQTRAIISAAIEVNEEENLSIVPEIMIPFVTVKEELIIVRRLIDEAAKEVIKQNGAELRYVIGTMIDTPRAALIADALAEESDFFVFGTNDLTNMTVGLMDHQIEEIVKDYQDKKIIERSPLQTLDLEGVGRLITVATELGRKTKKNLKFGMCGSNTSSPSTIEFCSELELDYISCDPDKIPSVKLAAAQAIIKKK